MSGLARAVDRRLVARLGVAAGMPPDVARTLADRARARSGGTGHVLRSLAFLVATRPGSPVLPAELRMRAAGALVTSMFRDPGDLLDYLGCESERGACEGLLLP